MNKSGDYISFGVLITCALYFCHTIIGRKRLGTFPSVSWFLGLWSCPHLRPLLFCFFLFVFCLRHWFVFYFVFFCFFFLVGELLCCGFLLIICGALVTLSVVMDMLCVFSVTLCSFYVC